MSDLIVLAFETEGGAKTMLGTVSHLQKESLIQLDDAAVVVRKLDGHVDVKQADSLVGAGALGGAFWGMLIGLLFFMPWLGLGIGAITGALTGKLTDIGIDDKFIKEVGQQIKPGNSALFLLVRASTPDKVLAEMQQTGGAHVLKTSLSEEKDARLRAVFAGQQTAAAGAKS